MNALTRTRRIARPLCTLTTAALIGFPLVLLLASGSGYFDESTLRDSFDMVTFPAISPTTWGLLYAINIASAVLVWLTLWNMRALLSLYSMGDVLGQDAALRIRRIGTLLLALAIWGVLSHTLTVVALTWPNPPGERSLSIAFSNTDLFLFLAAGLMSVIGWAMTEAARIADENRGFV